MDAVHLAVQHLQHLVTLFPKILPNTLRRQKKLLCQGCMRVFITAAIAKKVWNSVIKWVVNPLSLAILIVLNNFKRRKILFLLGLFAYTIFQHPFGLCVSSPRLRHAADCGLFTPIPQPCNFSFLIKQ